MATTNVIRSNIKLLCRLLIVGGGMPTRGQKEMKGWIYFIATMLALQACATPEFKEAETKCGEEAARLFPVLTTQQLVTVPIVKQVPSGNINCLSQSNVLGQVETNCQQQYRNEYGTQAIVADIDSNLSARTSHTRRCTLTTCLAKFGNERCEELKGESKYVSHETPRQMLCQTDSDCGLGKSCRSRLGGGTICRERD